MWKAENMPERLDAKVKIGKKRIPYFFFSFCVGRNIVIVCFVVIFRNSVIPNPGMQAEARTRQQQGGETKQSAQNKTRSRLDVAKTEWIQTEGN